MDKEQPTMIQVVKITTTDGKTAYYSGSQQLDEGDIIVSLSFNFVAINGDVYKLAPLSDSVEEKGE